MFLIENTYARFLYQFVDKNVTRASQKPNPVCYY